MTKMYYIVKKKTYTHIVGKKKNFPGQLASLMLSNVLLLCISAHF